jgi:hypothetical protein
MKTLAVTSSRPEPEILAAHEVLAHSRATFHLYTCGLRGDTDVVAVALISYNDLGVLSR